MLENLEVDDTREEERLVLGSRLIYSLMRLMEHQQDVNLQPWKEHVQESFGFTPTRIVSDGRVSRVGTNDAEMD